MNRYWELVINFCRGFAWAVVALATLSFFMTALPLGFVAALASSAAILFAGLILIAFFEIPALLLENLKEKQKQTRLLDMLASRSSADDE